MDLEFISSEMEEDTKVF